MLTETVTTDELSGLLGISERQVQKLAGKGVLAKTSRGQYPLAENVQAYIAYKLDTNDTDESRDELFRDKLKQEIRKLERENDFEEGLLCNRRDFIAAGQPIMMRLSNDLSRMGEIAADSGADLDPKQIENINEHFVKYKNELANLADTMLTSSSK